jgi:hypothetical protein
MHDAEDFQGKTCFDQKTVAYSRLSISVVDEHNFFPVDIFSEGSSIHRNESYEEKYFSLIYEIDTK